MKVIIITPRICPSRFNYYFELGKLNDLIVISELKPESKDFETSISNSRLGFKLIYLNGIVIKDYLSISFKIIKLINSNLNSIIIVEQYSSPTSMLAILLLKMRRTSFYLNADGGFVNFEESRIKKYIKTFFISAADRYLSSSQFASNYLSYYGANHKNIDIYPISSSPYIEQSNFFSSDEERINFKSNVFKTEKPIITYVGRFVPEKGFDLFVDVVKSGMVDANFLLIGGQLDHINFQTGSHDNLKVLNHVSSIEVSRYLCASDLHVIPSRNDVWNYTLVEAYSMGTRVVASDKTGAAIEILYNKDNFMFPSGNVKSMISVINHALSYKIMDVEASYYLKISKKYSSENMAKTIHDILKTNTEIINGK